MNVTACSLSHLPAINRQYLSGNVGACPTCEKHNRAFEVVWIAPSARWDAIQDAGSSRFVVDQGIVHVGVDISWRNLRHELANALSKGRSIGRTALTLIPLDAH